MHKRLGYYVGVKTETDLMNGPAEMLARTEIVCSTATPWGRAESCISYAEGITFYVTPSHGGFHLSAARMNIVRALFRGFVTFAGGPWFEEDCDYCVVVLAFQDVFTSTEVSAASAAMRCQNFPRYECVRAWLNAGGAQ